MIKIWRLIWEKENPEQAKVNPEQKKKTLNKKSKPWTKKGNPEQTKVNPEQFKEAKTENSSFEPKWAKTTIQWMPYCLLLIKNTKKRKPWTIFY